MKFSLTINIKMPTIVGIFISINREIFISDIFSKKELAIVSSFACHYWQWPIRINCVMCYYLCVLRWLMRLVLALNCLLQIEQERSEEKSSVGDALALAFRCARFCSASLILFASYLPAPLLWGLATLYDPVQSVPMTVGMLKSLREALRVSLYRFLWPPWERFPTCSSP